MALARLDGLRCSPCLAAWLVLRCCLAPPLLEGGPPCLPRSLGPGGWRAAWCAAGAPW